MCQNNLIEVKECTTRALPHVDHIVIVDGGSQDDSIFYLRNWSQEEPKIHFYVHPWQDNFSGQRNNYLKHASEFAEEGDWVLVSDPDEWFEEKTFKNLHNLATYAEKTGYSVVGFQCRSVTLKGEKRVWENLDQYWKHLFYKWESGMHYVGNPHEGMVLPKRGFRMTNSPFIYEHLKQENVIWKRGNRNSFVGGGGDNVGTKNKLWVELKSIVKDIFGRDLSWHEYEKYLIKNILYLLKTRK